MAGFHPSIVPIRIAYANAYLIQNGPQSLLVDTGLQLSGSKILQEIKKAGIKPSDIRLIVLTHAHYDHCKGAKAIQAATGAGVLVHRDDAPKLRKGHCRLPRGTNVAINAWVSMGRIFMPRLAYFPAVEPNIVVDDEYRPEVFGPDIRIIHTPGHTAGSITIILEGKHAILGDTMVGHMRSPFPPFADDIPTLMRSWKGLIDEGIEYFYPGHGRPFTVERVLKEYSFRKGSFTN